MQDKKVLMFADQDLLSEIFINLKRYAVLLLDYKLINFGLDVACSHGSGNVRNLRRAACCASLVERNKGKIILYINR